MVMLLLGITTAYLMAGLQLLVGIELPLQRLILFLFSAAVAELPIDLWLMSKNEEANDYGKNRDW